MSDCDKCPYNPQNLSNRELEVLIAMAQGDSNKKIADDFRISEQTVKNHVSAIYVVLKAKNRADAVAKALRKGLIE